MSIILQDAGNILMKTFFPGRLDYRLSIFYSEDAVDVQLGIGI